MDYQRRDTNVFDIYLYFINHIIIIYRNISLLMEMKKTLIIKLKQHKIYPRKHNSRFLVHNSQINLLYIHHIKHNLNPKYEIKRNVYQSLKNINTFVKRE